MGITLDFSVDGEKQLSRFLDISADSVKDLMPLFRLIAKDFRTTREKIFAAGGAADGHAAYAPLSFKYKAWKDRHFPGRPILTLTGAMRKAFTDANDPSNITMETGQTITFGANIGYAIFHQRGTYKMPQRKVIDLSNAEKNRWTRLSRDYIWQQMTDKEREAMQWSSGTPNRR